MFKPELLAAAASVLLAGCGQPKVEVNLPLAILDVAPGDGATEVDLAAVPTVCFSRAMDPARATGALLLEQLESGSAATGLSLVAGADPRCLLMQHDPLLGNTGYVIKARKGLTSADGETLASDISARFWTVASQ